MKSRHTTCTHSSGFTDTFICCLGEVERWRCATLAKLTPRFHSGPSPFHTLCTSNTTDPCVTSTAGVQRSPWSTTCRTRYRTGFPSTRRFQINNSFTSQSERKFLTLKFCTLQNAWSDQSQVSHFTECAELTITGLALFKVHGRPRHKFARLCVRRFQRNATREVSLDEEMTQRFSYGLTKHSSRTSSANTRRHSTTLLGLCTEEADRCGDCRSASVDTG